MSEKTKDTTTDDGWEKSEVGGFIKFENPGDGFTGLIVDHEVKQTPKGPAQNYKVVTATGLQSFFAPKGLHDQLSGIIIRYGKGNAIVKAEFKEQTKTTAGNDFKVFDVFHRPKTKEDLEKLGIDEGQADPSVF